MGGFRDFLLEVELSKYDPNDLKHFKVKNDDELDQYDKIQSGFKHNLNNGKKISSNKTHDFYLKTVKEKYEPTHEYSAVNRKTGKVDMHVSGNKGRNNTFKVDVLSGRTGSSIKAHHFYHHLMKHHGLILSTDNQSHGGYKVWQKLDKYPDIHIHGFGYNRSQGSHVDMKDRDTTHRGKLGGQDDESKRVRRMKLVAFHSTNPKSR